MNIPKTTEVTGTNTSTTPDLIDEIRRDHRELEEYYKSYKAATTTEEAHQYFNQFVWEISRHSVGEEVVVYNMLEGLGEKGKELSEHSREDHRKLKVMLEELRHEKNETLFEQKFDAVFKDLQEHIMVEELEEHPYLRSLIKEEDLVKAGKMFNLKKKIAPTRPHPGIPDKPTALEMALGLLIAPIDKIRDVFTDFPKGDVTSV